MTDSPARVHTRIDGPIGWIIFDNPGRHNAMSVAMWEGLAGAVDTLEADPAVRVVVLRGAGDKAFVSGADISQFDQVRDSVEANERYEALGDTISAAAARYAQEVRTRTFPGVEQTYQPK